MANNNENLDGKEKDQIPDFAWIFDVDGVITNLEQKRVREQQIFDEVIKRLQKSEPIGRN